MSNVLLSTLWALFVAVTCFAAGGLMARGLLAKGGGWPWPVQIVVGMTVLSTVFFGLLAGQVAGLLPFVGIGFGVIAVYVWLERGVFRWQGWGQPTVMTAVLVVYGALYLPHVLTPEITYDASGYHLGLAAEWLRVGGFPARIGFYELLPQGMDTIYGFALAGGLGSIAPKVVHFLCLAATVVLLFSVSRQRGLPPWAAPAAAVIYVVCPVVGLSATSAYTDVAFALAVLATFYLVMDAWHCQQARAWVAAGLAAGFCYAVKVPGLLVPAVTAVILLTGKRWLPFTGFAAGTAVAVVPWMGRSLLLTGNPFAPMLNTVFPNRWFSPEIDAYLRGIFQFASESGVRDFNIPMELAFHGGRLGLMGPMVLAVPLGLLGLGDKRARPIAVAGCLLFLIYTQNLSARFLLPAFLFLMLALAAMLPRRVAQGLALAAAVVCWPAVTARYSDPGVRLEGWPVRAALGLESQHEYLRRSMPLFGLAELVRAHVPEGARVFDCAGLPSYYSGTVNQQHWQTTELRGLHQVLLEAIPKGTRAKVGAVFAEHDIRFITIPAGPGANVPWAAGLMKEPESWGFRLAGAMGDYRLYEVR